MRLLRYAGTMPDDVPAAPGWPHADTADALAFAATSAAWIWLIVDDDGRVAGECGVKGPPDDDGAVEIGYGLAGPSRGRGLGGRAVAALLDELTGLGVRLVRAEVAVDNVASRRLLERLGFAVAGADRQFVFYERLISPRRTG